MINVKQLLEEYKPGKIGNKTLEVWENPTSSEKQEILDMADDIRFAAFLDEKKIVMWNALEMSHESALRTFYNIRDYLEDPKLVTGIWTPKSDYPFDIYFRKEYLEYDIGWINKYMPGFINHLKTKYAFNLYNKKITENYYDTFSGFDMREKSGAIEIFVNPTKEEMKKVSEDDMLRGIAMGDKLFIFNPYVYHQTVAAHILLKDKSLKKEKYNTLNLTWEKGKWTFDMYMTASHKKKYGWLKKYNIGFIDEED